MNAVERILRAPARAAAVLSAAACVALTGCATTSGLGAESAVIRAKNRVAPALVHIRPVKEVYQQGQRREVPVIGSGFIITPDGYIVTNEHVAGESRFVRCVLSDKSEVDARVVGVDPYTDLAVLKLDLPDRLPYVAFGDSDKLESGQTVIAMGSPLGLSRSVSMGIVSVTGRHLSGQTDHPFTNWIQTDAAINQGNSGGPLLNIRGEVIGVNTMVLRGAENVGFAIPSNLVRQVAEQIMGHGHVRRSWLGLELQEMLARTEDPTRKGVLVAGVDPLSPAFEARIQPGDILLSVGGTPTNARFEEDLPPVNKFIADLPVGEEVRLSLQRGDETFEVPLVTEERGGLKGAQVEFSGWGFTAAELTPAVVRRAGLDSREGVLVSGAQVGGIANKAGLAQGDIILSVDGVKVENLAGFKEVYDARVADKTPLVMLSVRNRALHRFVLIKQEPGAPAPLVEGTSDAE